MNCFADGIEHSDPELYLNGEPIDDQYLSRNWPTQITLSASNGIALEGLVGYFSCKTRSDSFNASHIITYRKCMHSVSIYMYGFIIFFPILEYDYVFFYEGTSIEVDLHDSVVIPFAHNYDYITDPEYLTAHYSLREFFNPPPFEFTTNVSRSNPFIVEFHIFNLQFSDSGTYRVSIYGFLSIAGGFNLTVRGKYSVLI